MSQHTHCDRCGEVGAHKDATDLTAEFPARVALRPESVGLITRTRTRELCQSCAVELALFLGDDELADEVSPDETPDAETLLDATEGER